MSGRKPTGFTGLASLVSDVEAIIRDAQQPLSASTHQPVASTSSSSAAAGTEGARPAPTAAPKPAAPARSTQRIRWGRVVGVLAAILIVWAMATQHAEPSAAPAPVSGASQPSTPDADSSVPNLAPAPTNLAPSEQEPQAGGAERVLSTSEIRYCLAEDIRLEGAKSAVDRYNDVQVQEFNANIDDYNQRCGRYTYQQGTLEAARADVEAHRSELWEEGRQRFAGTEPPSSDTQDQTGASPSDAPNGATRSAVQGAGESGDQSALAISTTPTQGRSSADGSMDGPDRRRAIDNLATCLSGESPTLCDHSVLSADEAQAVARAELAANLRTCVSGEYPVLCRHDLLTSKQAAEVHGAELRANYETCRSGEYPVLCRHDLLTPEQETAVRAAERRANYRTCITGLYVALCNHALLSAEEAKEVANAERHARTP